jgi:hypothetical protein
MAPRAYRRRIDSSLICEVLEPGCHQLGDVGLRHRLGLLRVSGRGNSCVQPDARPARCQPDLGPDRRDRQALTDEATQDRELGIQFRLPALVRQLNAQFQSDWSMAEARPA